MKLSFAFLAGVLMMAGEVYVTGARYGAPLFFAGFLFAVVPAIALLSSVDRLRRAARFLNGMAEGLEGAKAPHVERTKAVRAEVSHEAEMKTGYRKPSPKQRDQILQDTISEYLEDDDLFTAPKSGKVAVQ